MTVCDVRSRGLTHLPALQSDREILKRSSNIMSLHWYYQNAMKLWVEASNCSCKQVSIARQRYLKPQVPWPTMASPQMLG